MTARILTTVFSALALSACGQGGFHASSLASCGAADCDSNSGQGSGGGIDNDALHSWNQLNFSGAVGAGNYEGLQVVGIDKSKKELLVRMPMLISPISGVTGEIPVRGVEGARITLETLSNGNPVIVLRLPLTKILKKIAIAEPQKLPNGDDLPGIPGGELPAFAFTVNPTAKMNGTLYLERRTIALFVNTPFNPGLFFTVPVRSANNTQVLGYLAAIPEKNGVERSGGFFLSLILPEDVARTIDNVL